MTVNRFSVEATIPARTYYEGPSDVNDDERIHARYFASQTDAGLVVGDTYSIMFTIDRPAKEVWRYLKDFNLWQNEHQHYYSGVVGDLEGRTFHIGLRADEPGPHYYEVLKVIPEYLIVINQPVPVDGSSAGLPGLGGISPGFHVFMLNEHAGKTTVSIFMEHAARVAEGTSVEEALRPWRALLDTDAQPKWREKFIRTLKRLVYEGR
jgi:uncharacterized protein YndB with AHSA1/START domain